MIPVADNRSQTDLISQLSASVRITSTRAMFRVSEKVTTHNRGSKRIKGFRFEVEKLRIELRPDRLFSICNLQSIFCNPQSSIPP